MKKDITIEKERVCNACTKSCFVCKYCEKCLSNIMCFPVSDCDYCCFNDICKSKNILCDNCENICNCYSCGNCKNCIDCNKCHNCVDCKNCRKCFDCINCNNLENKTGWINNKPTRIEDLYC